MHYSEIRIDNVLAIFQPSCDENTLKVGVEDVSDVNGRIVGPRSLQGDGDPIFGQVHESCDHNNGGRDTVIN